MSKAKKVWGVKSLEKEVQETNQYKDESMLGINIQLWCLYFIINTYFVTVDDLPATVPQQDLYFFFEPHGHALFLGIFCKKST